MAYRDRLFAKAALRPQIKATRQLVRVNRVAGAQRALATAQHQQAQRALTAHIRATGLTRAAAAPPRLKRAALMSAAKRPARLAGGGRSLRRLW
jgi:hypothetical protein